MEDYAQRPQESHSGPDTFPYPYLLIIFFWRGRRRLRAEPGHRGYFSFTLFNAVCYLVLLTVILYL